MENISKFDSDKLGKSNCVEKVPQNFTFNILRQ